MNIVYRPRRLAGKHRGLCSRRTRQCHEGTQGRQRAGGVDRLPARRVRFGVGRRPRSGPAVAMVAQAPHGSRLRGRADGDAPGKGRAQGHANQTDRRDAEGIARLLQMGCFRPVHCKSVSAQEMRAVLTARKAVQKATLDIELSLRGVLRNFGLKMGKVSKGRYEARVRDLAAGTAMLETMSEALLRVRAGLRAELAGLERRLQDLAKEDAACRLMMTMPGVGPVVVPVVEGCRPVGGPDARALPVRGSGHRARDHARWRCRLAHCALPCGIGDDASGQTVLVEGVGTASRQTAWDEAGGCRHGAAHRSGSASDVDGWH